MWKDIENPCYYLLVEPTVVWWVHLVELGQDGPDGFVGEVVHQLLQAKKKKEILLFIHRRSLSLETRDSTILV
jgi:hypothetical protein